jgi:hypothetical protein
MQENPGSVPFGVAKPGSYYIPGANPQTPITSEGSQSPYGAVPQQWQQHSIQPIYGAPSPTMSQVPQNVQDTPYVASEARPFSSELEGSSGYGQSQLANVQQNK